MFITAQGPVSEVTYTASSGTLNSTIPYHTRQTTNGTLAFHTTAQAQTENIFIYCWAPELNCKLNWPCNAPSVGCRCRRRWHCW